MRSSVNLRAYGQRDPLVEYKKEGLRLFKDMQEAVDAEIVRLLPHVGGGNYRQEEEKLKEAQKGMQEAGGGENKNDSSQTRKKTGENDVGRNDPCPCGAKKADGTPVKYKHCHGK